VLAFLQRHVERLPRYEGQRARRRIVRDVSVELGAAVRRGEPLAVIVSSDLADAQIEVRLDARHAGGRPQKLERTQKLVALGSASRQELEEVTASHTGHETEVAAARQVCSCSACLRPPGPPQNAAQVVSEVTVPSPADACHHAQREPRQVVNSGQELFVVTTSGRVWVIGDLYERISRAFASDPGHGHSAVGTRRQDARRVAYIDPRVDSATRTAKVRSRYPIGVATCGSECSSPWLFKRTDGARDRRAPAACRRSATARSVYVPADSDRGKFVERASKARSSVGRVRPGARGAQARRHGRDEGSFFLRAEARDR